MGPVQRINSRFPARTAPPCCPDAPPRATRRVLQAPQTQSEWAESKILMIEGQICSLQQISGWYLGLRSAFFTSGPCSCTPSSGRDSSFLRLPAHVARRRAGHISSVPSHDRISFAPRPRVDGGAVGDCNWDDLSSPSNILFNLSHGRNTFPNTSGGSPLLGRHRQWYVIHRIFYALVLSSRYLSRGSRDLYVSLLIISSSHTSNLSLVFRFRSQAWSIRPRGRNISHLLHLHDLLDVRS